MGGSQKQGLQLSFNRFLPVRVQGSRMTSNGGLILVRELDERLGLKELIKENLSDSRPNNARLSLTDLPRQSLCDALEERGVKYAIRIPNNDNLQRDIEELLERLVGRPAKKQLAEYKGFLYQTAGWKTARWVAAKVEHHAWELFQREGVIVTNLKLPSRTVEKFYNKRGTTEQWIKEEEHEVKMTLLSCHRIRSNEVQPCL